MTKSQSQDNPSLFFAYRKPSSSNLLQGDLLVKNQEIEKLIGQVHPYYLKEDYTHFIVLTQSCDLARRKGKPCKSRYITLAAVRPLDLLIKRQVEKYQDDFDKAGKVCSKSVRGIIKNFLQKLLNFNEPEYFYLHDEAALDFPHPHCAFLRLSISIKASLHYDVCFGARILSLTDVFQAKLGWLVGNMYSRVGTEDWVDVVEPKESLEKRIDRIMTRPCQWVDDKKLRQAKEFHMPGLIELSQEDVIRKHIENTEIPVSTDLVAKAVIEELKKLEFTLDSEIEKKIGNRLKNNQIFRKFTKEPTAEIEFQLE